MMIRNANRNISVAVGHGYTLQKVKFAVNFVQKSGRNTTINDWVAAYNYIKDANETAQGCQACKAAKFTAAVRNYARYGYMTLLNEGYKPEDFKETVKVDEISKVDAAEPEVVSTVTETAGQGEPTIEYAIPAETTENGCIEEKQPETVAEQKPSAASKDVEHTKVRKKKNDKSDNK
ncbi:MAG: hypothetical protein II449_00305 [Prevotella sp.]|nr:hypothetical protein [Prevotella sp.]